MTPTSLKGETKHMKHRTFLNTLRHVAIFLAMIGMVGAANLVSAQVNDPTPVPYSLRMDFNGDKQVDLVFASPISNEWIIQNLDGSSTLVNIGEVGDRAAAADYDGDHMEDVAVVRSKGGHLTWLIQRSSDGKLDEISWGLDGDTLVQGDYDGDGLVDAAVWRSTDGLWYILSSKSGEMMVQHWGEPTDKAMPGDFDGDGVMDVCVYRPKTSSFFYFTSTSDLTHEQVFGPFVMSGYEVFAPADYDGDGITDFATFDATKGGLFVIRESSSGKYRTASLQGSSTLCNPFAPERCNVVDFAVPADYDNDGRVDPAIWDSKNGTVTAMGSSKGEMVFPTGTTQEMIPVSSFFMTK